MDGREGRTYEQSRDNQIFEIDGLLNFLRYGALLVRLRRAGAPLLALLSSVTSLVSSKMLPSDSRLRSEALFKFEDYRSADNSFIFVLIANRNIIGNSQVAKLRKELRLKHEIALASVIS